ncbi:MAG: cupin domain-containing protein [Aquabacterium sp.]|jgi:quercetin dioxygenase-like cupin family protein|uniref:cupin domain-containing protein n=1 Tax=Aquabacterium sp. TaxID=1872578 RepID=UPI002A365CB5|nr:cupin domain-containing protein [Aquabacterium sp.]MDX9842975.1 cupin domain-containing protein [Aquabacterium sp.]
MALKHATSGDLVSTLPLGPALKETPSHAFVKGRHLEVIRLVLHAGKAMPPHDVSGEVTVLCLEGCIELTVGQGVRTMQPGDHVYLDAREPHGLLALEDASALVTISLVGAPGQTAIR